MYLRFSILHYLLFLLALGLFSPELFAQIARLDLVSEFGGQGSEIGQFHNPAYIAVDQAGMIIVSDYANDRIQICNRIGECTAFGELGADLGQFDGPLGVALDDKGRLIIADSLNNRIQVCDYQGNCELFLDSNGNEPQLSSPKDLAFDSENHLHIINTESYTICPMDGACFSAEDESGVEISFKYAWGLAIDKLDGTIVADMGANRILMCEHSSSCRVLLGFDAPIYLPLPPGAFSQPQDVSIDANGRIYIAEGRLQICDLGEDQCYVVEGYYGDRVTVGPDNLIYVANEESDDVLVLRLLELSNKFPINPGLNGPWYDPESPGQGFFVNVFPETKEMFLGWFTYDLEPPVEEGSAVLGDPGHRWLTAQGHYKEDTAHLQTFLTEGGKFLSSTPAAETNPAGELVITFRNCSEAELEFDLDSNGGEVFGKILLARISDENISVCEQLAAKSYAY